MTILLYDLVGADASRPFSPHCWKAAMALAHKSLPFERVPTPFTKVPLVEGGAFKTVPVLRDRDTLVVDSFEIARYLDAAYPDRPSLFGGPGGEAAARFIERWCQSTVQAQLMRFVVADIWRRLSPVDQAYFRDSRERRLGMALEAVEATRDQSVAAFRSSLAPLRDMLSYQPFIGGDGPLFADYIVFGAFQWARVMSPFRTLETDDPVALWLERCLDLHGGLGRAVPPAEAV
ncbi:MAG: glutathione S-transferase family protein [Rhizobiaceae bacterium]